jgi:hypothetical protein
MYERITNENIKNRINRLNELVSKYLGITLSITNSDRLYFIIDEKGNYFPHGIGYIGKRDLYESMGLIINTILQILDRKDIMDKPKPAEITSLDRN